MSDNATEKPWGMEVNTFCMLLHLSQLAGYVIPLAGLVLPVVMWATNKDRFPAVDKHGKNIFNWMLSALIYLIIASVLMVIAIGYIGYVAVALCTLVFAIIGAVKANDGTFWEYPLAIKFFKTHEQAP